MAVVIIMVVIITSTTAIITSTMLIAIISILILMIERNSRTNSILLNLRSHSAPRRRGVTWCGMEEVWRAGCVLQKRPVPDNTRVASLRAERTHHEID